MAWIKERPSGYLVCWRDAETGRERSELVKFGTYLTLVDFGTIEGPATEEADRDYTRRQAEGLQRQMYAKERRATTALDRVRMATERRGEKWPEPIFGPDWGQPEFVFENYLRRIIDQDTELRESTRELYMVGIKTHISGTSLGSMHVEAITADTIRDYWAGLSKRGVGVGARRNVHLLLSKAFTRAVRDGLVSVSPLVRADIKRPAKGRRTEVVPLTVAQIERLAEAAAVRNPRDRVAVLLMGYAGLRAGEVGGLREQDVDFGKCRLSIRQQVVRTHEGKYVSPLKSKAARRTIEIACSIIEELKVFLETNAPADDGRIFYGREGSLWAHNTINTAVQKGAERAGIRGVHSHMLRHTAVSLLIDSGANAKAIQQFVGHATIGETLGTYGHLFDYGGSALAQMMEERRETHRHGSAA